MVACKAVLRPLIGLLLRHGVQHQELSELAKQVYVEVARDHFSAPKGRNSVSRIAMLTGLHRKQVKQITDAVNDADDPVAAVRQRQHRITRILSAWHDDPVFLDTNGRPRVLARSGADPSIELLMERFAGDIPASSLLREMLNVGAVEQVARRKFEVKKRAYVPATTDPKFLIQVGSVLEDVAETLIYNVHRDEQRDIGRFQRRATELVPERELPAFTAFARDKAMSFLETIDDWIIERRRHAKKSDRLVRTGIGVYWIQGSNVLAETRDKK